MTSQALPSSLEAERTILGMLIHSGRDGVESVRSDLPVDAWYAPHHQQLYALAVQLADAGRLDPMAVMDAVTHHRDGDAPFGGLPYVIEIIGKGWPVASVPVALVREVADLAVRRKAIAALDRARALLMRWTPGDDPGHAVATLRMELDAAESGRPTADEWDDYADLIPRAVEMSRAAASGGAADMLGPLLPFRSLRAYRERARPGSMLVVAALQKVGKSVLARQVAEEIATQGYVVGVYSLEIDGLAVATKTLAATARTDHAIAQAIPLGAVSGMSARELESGQVDGVAWDRVVDAAGGLASMPVRVAKRKNFTVPDLVASMGRLARWAKATGRKLGCVVIDYFQLLTVPIARGRNQADALAEASRAIKVAAMEHGICVVLVSQLNRSAAEAKEGLKAHHMRGTSGLESDADMVLLIDRQPASSDARFIIPLNRGHQPCPEGFDMIFDGPSEAFACPLDRWW